MTIPPIATPPSVADLVSIYNQLVRLINASGGGGGAGTVTTDGDLTAGVLPKATGASEIGDSSLSDDGTMVSTDEQFASGYVLASVVGATISAGGAGGTLGAPTVVTGTTGTGTKFQAAVTIADSVTTAVVNNAGDGSGTPGPVTITGTTGTGTKFEATGTIDGGGLLTDPLSVTVRGVYTVDPTTTGEAVTSNAGLVGATVDLTLTDGPIHSVDSVTVAGAYTVPPTDPTAEPVTGGGLVGATLNLGLSFAPGFVGDDATSGFFTAIDGETGITLASGLLALKTERALPTILGGQGEGISIRGTNPDGFGLGLMPAEGLPANTFLFLESYAQGFGTYLSMFSSQGVKGAPAPSLSGDDLFGIEAFGWAAGDSKLLFEIYASAAEDFSATSAGITTTVYTTKTGSLNRQARLVWDSDGDTNIQNGVLTVESHAPAAANSAGKAGTITWEAGFLYVCVATNTWQRVATATWP